MSQTHLLSFSLNELKTRKCESTASTSLADFLSLWLPNMALSSDPAFPANRIKCPVEADIDLLSSMPAKELSHWGKKGKAS